MKIFVLKSRIFPAESASATDGGSINAIRIVEALCHQGHQVTVFTRQDNSNLDSFTCQILRCGAQLWAVPYKESNNSSLMLRDFEEGRSFVKNVAKCPSFTASAADCIHLHHWTSSVGIQRYISDQTPIVFTPHLLPSEKARSQNQILEKIVEKAEQKILERSDAIIALSEDENRSIGERFESKTRIIPNGISQSFFDAPVITGSNDKKIFRIGVVGRISHQKGHDVLLEAFSKLLKKRDHIRLDIVGHSYSENQFEENIRNLISEAPLKRVVTLYDAVSHSGIADLMRQWDLYIQPSRYESQGIALLEAMASAKLVIATNLPAISSYIDNSKNGVLIGSPPQKDELAAVIERCLDLPNPLSIQIAARKTAQTFSESESTKETCEVLKSIGEEKSGERHVESVAHRLRKSGESMITSLLKKYSCEAIMILGSAARGPAREGSDLDIAIVTKDQRAKSIEQIWDAGTPDPVDLRLIQYDSLIQLSRLDGSAFARQAFGGMLPDILSGARILHDERGFISDLISDLVNLRTESSIKNELAALNRSEAGRLARKAEMQVAHGKFEDAQMQVYRSCQHLMISALILRGWIVQGAKRRPEILAEYVRADPSLTNLANDIGYLVGYDSSCLSKVKELVANRQIFRQSFLGDLVKLGAKDSLVSKWRSHISSSSYYDGAVTNGLYKGVVNHIRGFSGVLRAPLCLAKLGDGDLDNPATWCIESKAFSTISKRMWNELCPIGDQISIRSNVNLLVKAIECEERVYA